MGDHRAEIKIEFTIHGKTYKQEWWINWWANDDGVDQRIVDWLANCWEDAYMRYNEGVNKILEKEEKERIEAEEKAELERLQAKYEKK